MASPDRISSSSPGGILHAHPPPWANCVSRYVVLPAPAVPAPLVSISRIHEIVDASRLPCADSHMEAYRCLVALPVFKTGVTRYPGRAGSIPVRLRQTCRNVNPHPVRERCS